jgi:hypothetical protein
MTTAQQTFLDTLLTRKGQIVTVKTTRPVKVRKGMPAINKTSEFQCRVGVNYDNIATVKEGRTDGTLPAENAGLPWGEWEIFPYVIAHKGERYVRCTLLQNNFHRAPVFTLEDGSVIAKEDVIPMALASEFKEGNDNAVFNIKLSSILDVA